MRTRAIYAGAAIAAVLGPAAAVLLSVQLLTGASLADFRPYLNDEVYYWHQIATAAAVGTDGGYYGSQELTASVEAVRFGAHGPVFPLLAGSIARVTGWHRASAPLFNLAWIAVCTLALLALARPSTSQIILIAVLLVTFWPLLFWSASNMQESFHHGIAIVLAGAFISLGRGERAGLVAAWAVLLLAVMTRLSWGLLLPGLCIMSLRLPTKARITAAAVAGVAIAAVAVGVFSLVAPPIPGAFQFLTLVRSGGDFALPLANARLNLGRLVDVSDNYDPIEIVHRLQYLVLMLAVAGCAAVSWARRRRDPIVRRHLTLQASSLLGVVAAMVLFYQLTNWTEHRIISGHVLLAALTLSLLPGRSGAVVAALLIATNIVALPIYAESFMQTRSDNFDWDRRSLRRFEEAIDNRVRYQSGVSPWCNTLLTTQYPPDFIAVPPGIGITVARSADDIPLPPRSRYLLLDAPAYAAVGERLHLEEIGAVLYGTIYINLDARCD